METKSGIVSGYDRFFIQTINPVDKPNLKDFEGDDEGYILMMQLYQRAENNRKKYPVIEIQQKIAKIFKDKIVNFQLIKIDDLWWSKIIGNKNEKK